MTVDAALYIGSIDETLPLGADFVYEGDDQMRATKKAVRQSFPMVTGPVTATHTELCFVAGATSALQPQIAALAPMASPVLTGLPTAPTATATTATTQLATTAFVQSAIASLVASQATMVLSVNNAVAINAASGQHLVLTNVATVTVTLPAAPAAGDTVWVTTGNGLSTNVIARNGLLIMGLAEDMTLDNANATYCVRYINSTLGWRLV